MYSADQLVQTVSDKASAAKNITLACGTYLLDKTYLLQNPVDQQRDYKVGLPIGSTPDGTPTGKKPVRLTAASPRCAVLDAAAHAGDPRSVIGIALWEVVTLDGLVIQGGFIGGPTAKDNYDNNMGGGILNLGHTVHLIDTDVQGNIASQGGAGIHNVGSHGPGSCPGSPDCRSVLRLVNSRVLNNRVPPSKYAIGGAGIYNDANPRLELVNATIENNTAVCKGTTAQDGTLLYCVGGGIQVSSGGALEASGKTNISHNHADQGGGLMLGPPWAVVGASNSTVVATLIDSVVEANNATMYGGGAYIGSGKCYLQMENGTVLKNNTAPAGHGKALYSVGVNTATYVVPAAPGYYVYPTFECKERTKGIDCPLGDACPPICNTTLLDGKHLSNLSVVTDDDYPYLCPIGSYCDGVDNKGLCPAGVRGDEAGNKDSSCGGPCPARYYCPNAGSGSTSPILCPKGTYNEHENATDASWCLPCPPGHYCNAGARWRCGNNTYGSDADPNTRISTASCIPCSSNAHTLGDGSVDVSQCVCLNGFYRNDSSNDECMPCPVGAMCDGGAELATLRLLPGYWRASKHTNDIRKCPTNATCVGDPPWPVPLASTNSTCSPGVDPAVPYCSRCLDYPSNYLDLAGPTCVKCRSAWVSVSSAVGGLLVVAASGLLAWRTGSTRVRSSVQERVSRGVVLGKKVKRYIVAKIKQALGFYQIVTHLHEVYGVTMPANFYKVSKPLNLLNFDPSDLPGLNAQCFGMSSFFRQLVARCVAPMVAIVLAFLFFKLRGRSFKEATPFVLWLTFLVFAMVSSPAFQAFSCEQFDDAAYLRADYGVVCWEGSEYSQQGTTPEWQRIQAIATAIIVIYPVGVPLLYALLLFGSNSATVQGSMGFLTDNYRESVRWWELAEVFKRMLLAGFFALPFFNPGTLVQLLLALMATLAFTIVQVNVAPFKQQSDHHFAVCANAALLFVLLCCVVLEQDALIQAIWDKLPPHMRSRYHIAAEGVSVALAISTFFVLGSLVAAPLLERGCLLPAARRLHARLGLGRSSSKGANEEALLPSTQPRAEEASAAPAAPAGDA